MGQAVLRLISVETPFRIGPKLRPIRGDGGELQQRKAGE